MSRQIRIVSLASVAVMLTVSMFGVAFSALVLVAGQVRWRWAYTAYGLATMISERVVAQEWWTATVIGTVSGILGVYGWRIGRHTKTLQGALRGMAVVAIVVSCGIGLSYMRARNAMRDFVRPYRAQFDESELRFSPGPPMPSLDGTSQGLPMWATTLCPSQRFCCFPVGIHLTVSGQLLVPDPADLNRQLRRWPKAR